MKKLLVSLSLLITTGYHGLFSQVQFNNRNDLINAQPAHSGAPIGVVDLNGDSFDDIVRINQVNQVSLVYQFPDSVSYPVFPLPANLGGGAWSVCAADLDNDGLLEVLAGGAYTGITLFRPASANPGDYAPEQLEFSNEIFLQASNAADIDNDGWLDYFGCHDDGPSRIWANNQSGNLLYSFSNLINLLKFPTTEQNSGNYGSVWTDFDSDGDLDLYIAKCRQNVTGFSDPRRINQLWENDGNNNYSENAQAYGLGIGAQSWTGEFGDLDNDGDLDCLLTNHDVPSQLLRNDGNATFTDITQQAGVLINGLPIQAVMRDFDNDGFLDILVSGSSTQLFLNNGNGTFNEVDAGITGNLHSFACGDLNRDGFVDIYGGYGFGYNTPTFTDDVLWINEGNSNHYLAVNLEGTVSNHPGVGARLELWGPWGIMVREVRAGESYGIVNSLTAHFGLGELTEADRLVVRWPSGNVSILENPPVDTFLQVVETDCIAAVSTINLEGSTVLCPGDTALLSIDAGVAFLWSNGQAANPLTVTSAGVYTAYVKDSSGCWTLSEAVRFQVGQIPDPALQYQGSGNLCSGESLTLSADPDGNAWVWSTGDTNSVIVVENPGDYYVSIAGDCGLVFSDTVVVEVYNTELPYALEGDTIFEPGTALLKASGDSLLWYGSQVGGIPLGSGSIFETPFIGSTTTFFVGNNLFTFKEAKKVGPAQHTGTSLFSGNDYNGDLEFTVESDLNWKSVKVFTDTPGKRTLDIYRSNNLLLTSRDLDIQDIMEDTLFELNVLLEAGDYRVTTRTAVNQNELGYVSPRLVRSNEGIAYPYSIDQIIQLTGSSAGSDLYYYFYDWEIEPLTICRSQRLPVKAVVDIENSIMEGFLQDDFEVFPNPFAHDLTLVSHLEGTLTLQVVGLTGQVHFSKRQQIKADNPLVVNLDQLPAGNYWLLFQMANKQGRIPITKQ